MKNLPETLKAISIVILIVFIISSLAWIPQQQKTQVAQWSRTNGFTVSEDQIEQTFLFGPWLRLKGMNVFRAQVRDPEGKLRVLWFRFHLFGNEVQEETSEGVYQVRGKF